MAEINRGAVIQNTGSRRPVSDLNDTTLYAVWRRKNG